VRIVYSLTLYALLPFVLMRLVWRGVRARSYWHGWRQRFGFSPRFPGGVIWVHAVSVGEVQAASPLLSSLKEDYRDRTVLVTTTTPTGAQQLHKLFGEQVAHCYFPYDLPDMVERFLNRANPAIAIIMETEVWPNMFHACSRHAIPVILANARMSARSARAYRRVAGLVRATLTQVSAIAAQSQSDGQRLIDLGAPSDRVHVTGSIKFDIQVPERQIAAGRTLRRQIGEMRPVWIVASTHENEEKQLLPVLQAVRERLPDSLLIVVPRHPERFTRVADVFRKTGYLLARRSEQAPFIEHIDVFVGDTMGELPMYYAAADVAVIGGSFVPVGGHNPLEPAAIGLPVIVGPHVFNFDEVVQLLEKSEALIRVRDTSGLTEKVCELLADASLRRKLGRNAGMVMDANRGACERVQVLISNALDGTASGNATSRRRSDRLSAG